MNAIIRLGNGKYYTSEIFACYNDNKDDKYGFEDYYIILNQEKTKLIKQPLFNKNKKYLDRLILICDSSKENWNVDELGYGEINFLTKNGILKYIENNNLPESILVKSLELDSKFKYKEYNEINTEKDIEIFMNVSGGLHDAIISDIKEENDSLYILFTGTWGCKIEIILKNDITYLVESKDIEKNNDPFWYDANILIDKEYKILVDSYDVNINEINNDYCWFRAKEIIYRVVPE